MKMRERVQRGMELLSWEIPRDRWRACIEDPLLYRQPDHSDTIFWSSLGVGATAGFAALSYSDSGFMFALCVLSSLAIGRGVYEAIQRQRRSRIDRWTGGGAKATLTTLGLVFNDTAILWRSARGQLTHAALIDSGVEKVSYLSLRFDNDSFWRPSSFVTMPVPHELHDDVNSLIDTILTFGKPPRVPSDTVITGRDTRQ